MEDQKGGGDVSGRSEGIYVLWAIYRSEGERGVLVNDEGMMECEDV